MSWSRGDLDDGLGPQQWGRMRPILEARDSSCPSCGACFQHWPSMGHGCPSLRDSTGLRAARPAPGGEADEAPDRIYGKSI
ncbi:hypothetical protein GUJ93_ZPchr0008g13697 [Zizania palustris]|uniref:Uncharacterized protein n=1 Tax=Zizania palustris TaxID=103762 RepID=A0A8J5V0W6_ZIZPA|nr:hypothetical protein GUJ93_ZPchr0008g13697 [Zizania palustris]